MRTVEALTVVNKASPKVLLVGTIDPLDEEKEEYPAETKTCDNGTTVTSSVDENIKAIHDVVCRKFPEIKSYGTLRDSCTNGCDHKDGKALDIMVSGSRGWQVAEYLRINQKELGIKYLIYEQAIWAPYRPIWRPMEDRGSITANHFDHVHVSVN